MPRSKTGVKGLRRDRRGRYLIDFRYVDRSTGEKRRYVEDLPEGINAATARERARIVINAAYTGTLLPARTPMTLRAALDKYVEWAETDRPRTAHHRRHLAGVLLRHLGEDTQLANLSPFGLEQFKKSRTEDGVQPATVNRAVTMFRHFVRLAAEWGWVSATLARSLRDVRTLSEPEGRVRFLTHDEASRLLAALPDDVREIAVTAMLTGMRRGEILNLRKAMVDLVANQICVTRTKTNKARFIPIHEALTPILRRAIERSSTEYVFTNPHGRPYSHRIAAVFRSTVRKLGIVDLRFHDLRHDFATKLRRNGMGLDLIAALLGHTTLAMTQRYAHLGRDDLRAAVSQLRTIEKARPSNVVRFPSTADNDVKPQLQPDANDNSRR